MSEDEKLLLAEYETFNNSFRKNEELGEKRVEFYITLTTAIIAAIVALLTRSSSNLSDDDVRLIAIAALSGTFLFGFLTYLRMLHRNRVTDEYKKIVSYIREQLRQRSVNLAEYDVPFQTHKRLLRGGLADTVALMNSIVLAVITALLFGKGLGWLAVPIVFAGVFIAQVAFAKSDRDRKAETPTQAFRAGVGAIILNSEGQVLAFERSDYPGSWQLPQGGLNVGESPQEAVMREILEETGINRDLELLSTEPRWLAYELPPEARSDKTGRGQVQQWFLFRYGGSDVAITRGDKQEFQNWRWMNYNELMTKVVPFKMPLYQELAEHFKDYLQKTT